MGNMMMEYEEESPQEFDLMDYWRVIVKRKGVLFTFAGAVILLIGIYSFTAPPKYKPTTSLLIGEETSRILRIEDELGFGGYNSQIKEQIFINTQVTLLKSESLAERVARKMDLAARKEFGAEEQGKKKLGAKIKDFITFKWLKSKKNDTENGEIYDLYNDIAEDLLNSLDISQVRDTKIIKLSYTSKHPVLATAIVNTLAQEFINFSVEKRYETTQQASDFLSEQIVNIREDLAAKERELQRYGQEKELFFLSDSESAAVNKFSAMDAALTQAQIDRVNAEAAYRELQELEADSMPQYVNNPAIMELKKEYSNIKNEFEEKSKIYKPDYPEMVQLKARMDSMKDEIRNAVKAAESEWRAALNKEQSLRRLRGEQERDVAKMNSNAILYNSLKIEVENKRNLLNSLVERQNETLVSARLGGLKTSNITIVDQAKVPKDPVSPKKKLNLVLALLMGTLGGIGLCFIFEYVDNTVKGDEDVQRLTGLPSLGLIPYLSPDDKKKKRSGYYSRSMYGYGDKQSDEEELPEITEIEFINHLHPQVSIAEDYRTVRTSILLSHAEKAPKIMVFSSTLPMEGKTATVANMAVAFAQLEKKVLVIDADLRKPRLHRLFKGKNTRGLSTFLAGKIALDDIIQKTEIENIWLLPSGPVPPNPAELLNSQRMKIFLEGMKKGFDFVLIDTPPVLSVVDARILGSLAESVILVVQPEKTPRKQFQRAVEELKQGKAKISGVIFNQARIRNKYDYQGYYHSYRSTYGQEETGKP